MRYRCAVSVANELGEMDSSRTRLREHAQLVAQANNWLLWEPSGEATEPPADEIDVLLKLDAQGWSARWMPEPKWKPLRFDYAHPAFRRRLAKVGPRAETLIKALGRRRPERILDCTGGAGEESLLFSAYGAQVHMVERDPVLAILIADALARANAIDDAALNAIAGRVKFQCADAIALLCSSEILHSPAVGDGFDVVYCDPMFPVREKSALVTKTMQFFHCLLGPPQDAADLVEAALGVAKHRVVVKRPAKAPCVLSHRQPDQQIQNKAVRFDIYLTK